MARQILITNLETPSPSNPIIELRPFKVDISTNSWDILREQLWIYNDIQESVVQDGLGSGVSDDHPGRDGLKDGAERNRTSGEWRLQSVRHVRDMLGHPVVEAESWGYIDDTEKKWYEGSGNYAKASTLDAKHLFSQFVGGEHWVIEVSFDDDPGTIAVPVSEPIPGPITLDPQELDGPSGEGLFRHEIQVIKGGLAMHRKYYAYHGTYWV